MRNIAFDLRETHIMKHFKTCKGEIESVNVPLNNKNNQNRGFAFVEFTEKNDAEAAVKAMNGTKFKGRPLTVEFALSKQNYEAKVENIMSNTNMDKDTVIKNKLFKEKKEEKKDGEAKDDEEMPEGEKEPEAEKKPVVKKEKFKKSDEKKAPRKEGENEQATLFVRNIGWNTTQDMFKDHMAKFGQIRYAVLCRAQGDKDGGEESSHRGTGFVRFVHKVDADALVELSAKVEGELDEEWKKKNARAMNKDKEDVTEQIMGTGSLLKGELELMGRRLVVMVQVARTKVGDVLKQNQANKREAAGKGVDKRNLYLKKEGLLNEGEWIHKEPALTSKELE